MAEPVYFHGATITPVSKIVYLVRVADPKIYFEFRNYNFDFSFLDFSEDNFLHSVVLQVSTLMSALTKFIAFGWTYLLCVKWLGKQSYITFQI